MSKGREEYPDGPHKIVSTEELESCTGAGWKLVAVYEVEEVVSLTEDVPNPSTKGQNDLGYQSTVSVLRNVVVRSKKFHLAKRLDTRLEEMRERLHDAQARATSTKKENRSLDEAFQNLKKEFDGVQGRHAAVVDCSHRLVREKEIAQRKMYKLEGDLAKARKALGELKWKEICGEGEG